MAFNESAASSSPYGIQNVFRLPSNGAGTPSGLITPNQAGGARPGRLYFALGLAINIYPVYLKLYDKASAPTVGTDVPFLTLALASNTYWNGTTAIAAPQPFEFSFNDVGLSFKNGLAYAITKLPADTDTTAILAGDVTGMNIGWQ